MTECSMAPSGVCSSGYSHHVSHSGWSFQPDTGAHVSPPSSVRNSACGEHPPAYQTSASCDGVSQKTFLGVRCSRSSPREAGGLEASAHVVPPSVERKTVGPRWPVLDAARIDPSRATACWM